MAVAIYVHGVDGPAYDRAEPPVFPVRVCAGDGPGISLTIRQLERLLADATTELERYKKAWNIRTTPVWGDAPCQQCEYLGTFEHDQALFDLHACGNPFDDGTVTARWGEAPEKIYTGAFFGKVGAIPPLIEALRRYAENHGISWAHPAPLGSPASDYAEVTSPYVRASLISGGKRYARRTTCTPPTVSLPSGD